jgi:hypothetical protein
MVYGIWEYKSECFVEWTVSGLLPHDLRLLQNFINGSTGDPETYIYDATWGMMDVAKQLQYVFRRVILVSCVIWHLTISTQSYFVNSSTIKHASPN